MKNILYADPDQDYADIMIEFMEIAGHVVTHVTDGQLLLDELESDFEYDIVVSCLLMSEKNGAQAYREARERGEDVPFVFISNHVSGESVQAVLAQMDDPTVWEKGGNIAGFLTEHIE